VRGGAYWIAYRRVAGHLRKAYVGGAAAVTQARLHALARAFLETADDPDPDR